MPRYEFTLEQLKNSQNPEVIRLRKVSWITRTADKINTESTVAKGDYDRWRVAFGGISKFDKVKEIAQVQGVKLNSIDDAIKFVRNQQVYFSYESECKNFFDGHSKLQERFEGCHDQTMFIVIRNMFAEFSEKTDYLLDADSMGVCTNYSYKDEILSSNISFAPLVFCKPGEYDPVAQEVKKIKITIPGKIEIHQNVAQDCSCNLITITTTNAVLAIHVMGNRKLDFTQQGIRPLAQAEEDLWEVIEKSDASEEFKEKGRQIKDALIERIKNETNDQALFSEAELKFRALALQVVLSNDKYALELRSKARAVFKEVEKLENRILPEKLSELSEILKTTTDWIVDPKKFDADQWKNLIGKAENLTDGASRYGESRLGIALIALGATLVSATLIALVILFPPVIIPVVAAFFAKAGVFLAAMGISEIILVATDAAVGGAAIGSLASGITFFAIERKEREALVTKMQEFANEAYPPPTRDLASGSEEEGEFIEPTASTSSGPK